MQLINQDIIEEEEKYGKLNELVEVKTKKRNLTTMHGTGFSSKHGYDEDPTETRQGEGSTIMVAGAQTNPTLKITLGT